jgi:hypothetical protein
VLASVAYIVLNVGCSGTVRDIAPGAAGTANLPRSGDNAGASGGERTTDVLGGRGNIGAAPGQAGDGGALAVQPDSGTGGHDGACKGDLNTVAASWWTKCPPTLSAAMAWAESCPATQSGAITQVATCGLRATITFDYGTHGKDCHYDIPPPCQGEAELVGAEAWDDVPTYCEGTSNRIEAGRTTLRCADHPQQSRVLCVGPSAVDPTGGTGGEAGTGGEDPGPKEVLTACHNSFGNTCEPCCPAKTPECTDKPDGYPGYACTPAPDSFCSCQCSGGHWACGC